MEIEFVIERRKNRYAIHGTEWVLICKFGKRLEERWVIAEWEYQPNKVEVEFVKGIIKRSFDVYHRQIKIPEFNLTVIDNDAI